jgi:hypothetical protein
LYIYRFIATTGSCTGSGTVPGNDDMAIAVYGCSYKKKKWKPPSNKERRREKKTHSPRKREACQSISTALLQMQIHILILSGL